MLELKRKAGQCVVIGDSVQLTVKAFEGAQSVRVLIELEGAKIDAPLRVGAEYRATVDGYPLTLQIVKVERGEASMRFNAVRELRIDRWERVV